MDWDMIARYDELGARKNRGVRDEQSSEIRRFTYYLEMGVGEPKKMRWARSCHAANCKHNR